MASQTLLPFLIVLTLALGGCADDAADAPTGTTTAEDDAAPQGDDSAAGDEDDAADAEDAQPDDSSDAEAADECESFPELTFVLSGATSGEGSTELADYRTDGDWAYLGFADSEIDANLDIAFPSDFTVGEPIDLVAAAAADPISETGGEVADTDYEEVTAGTLTVTGTGEQTGFPTICGTFEMTLQGDGGEVTVTGDFNNIPDVG